MPHHGRKPSNPQHVRSPRGARRSPPPTPPKGGGRPVVDGCSMWVPVAVGMLPWAMFKMWRDSRRG